MRKILIAVAFTGVTAAVALGAREHFLKESETMALADVATGTPGVDARGPAAAGPDLAESELRGAQAADAGTTGAGVAGSAVGPDVGAAGSAGNVGTADAAGTPDAAAPSDEAPTGEPETDELLRATAAAYESLRSLRADFVQRLENPLLGKETTTRGTLFQRRPDRFLLRFSEPEGDIIVSDGRSIWVYYPSIDPEQVIRASASPGGAGPIDLQAQFVGDPVERFRAERHPAERVAGREAYVVTLTPRRPAGYESLKVWIDARDHLIRRFVIRERSGLVRKFELRALELNPQLPDRLFEFEPPPGATIVERG